MRGNGDDAIGLMEEMRCKELIAVDLPTRLNNRSFFLVTSIQ